MLVSPEWNYKSVTGDVALLHLVGALLPETLPLPLAPSGYQLPKKADVTAWGYGRKSETYSKKAIKRRDLSKPGGKTSKVLRRTKAGSYQHKSSCDEATTWCLAHVGSSQITHGDSGGPWATRDKDPFVIGVTSSNSDPRKATSKTVNWKYHLAARVTTARTHDWLVEATGIFRPKVGTQYRDPTSAKTWLADTDGFARPVPTGGDFQCWQAQGHPVVNLTSFVLAELPHSTRPAKCSVPPGSAGPLVLVSATAGGKSGNAWSESPTVSADGALVAFASDATDLVPGDTNGVRDVFVRDVATGRTSLVSRSATGIAADSGSGNAVVSADGSTVAFESKATTLAPDSGDYGIEQIFVKDLKSGRVVVASRSSDGVAGNNWSYQPALSADGSRVAFISQATNLVPGDDNVGDWDGGRDIFVNDLRTGRTVLVSSAADGTPGYVQGGRGDTLSPSISEDGTQVAFASGASNLLPGDTTWGDDIYVKNVDTGAIALVSTNEDGTSVDPLPASPTISGDGTHVAWSSSSELVPGDTNGSPNVFVKDLASGELLLASSAAPGAPAWRWGSYGPAALSRDGTRIAFFVAAQNVGLPGGSDSPASVVLKNVASGAVTVMSNAPDGTPLHLPGGLDLSDDGTSVAFGAQPEGDVPQVYLRSLTR